MAKYLFSWLVFLQITLSKKDLRAVRKNMVSISNAISSECQEIEGVAVTFSAGSSTLVNFLCRFQHTGDGLESTVGKL